MFLKKTKEQGFSLVEMMVGLSLFGILMTGVAGTIHTSSIVSEVSNYDTAINTVVRGYLEQLKSLPYEEVLAATQNPANVTLATKYPSYDSNLLATIIDSPISIDPAKQPIKKTVQINQINNKSIDIEIEMYLTINDLSLTAKPIDALEIKIKYEYTLPHVLKGKKISKQVQVVRALA